jgi:hypothetical protein
MFSSYWSEKLKLFCAVIVLLTHLIQRSDKNDQQKQVERLERVPENGIKNLPYLRVRVHKPKMVVMAPELSKSVLYFNSHYFFLFFFVQ